MPRDPWPPKELAPACPRAANRGSQAAAVGPCRSAALRCRTNWRRRSTSWIRSVGFSRSRSSPG